MHDIGSVIEITSYMQSQLELAQDDIRTQNAHLEAEKAKVESREKLLTAEDEILKLKHELGSTHQEMALLQRRKSIDGILYRKAKNGIKGKMILIIYLDVEKDGDEENDGPNSRQCHTTSISLVFWCRYVQGRGNGGGRREGGNRYRGDGGYGGGHDRGSPSFLVLDLEVEVDGDEENNGPNN
ncbi:hypothetical protein L6452_14808 [Arctium lappa]|uniref:Uncharacterized protein n=1 Tax=Arctium lappa TaxID=4217 RepID=A0ACB9CM43_ARCLA|nr:hypothetical protein L6452_14808 [Arctium lappa]